MNNQSTAKLKEEREALAALEMQAIKERVARRRREFYAAKRKQKEQST